MTARRVTHWGFRSLVYLALGAGACIGITTRLARHVDPLKDGRTVTAEHVAGRERWALTVTDRWASTYIHSLREFSPMPGLPSWCIEQTLGPPNTSSHGDIGTAWASSSSDGSPMEWVELDYSKPVVPEEVHVYETYNPGALVRVTVYNPAGEEVEAWVGVDPSPQQPQVSISKVPLSVSFPVNRVRIYLASGAVPGWNEIDAVGLQARDDSVQWAVNARASSAYSVSPASLATINSVTSPSPGELQPRWASSGNPFPAIDAQGLVFEERVSAAFGWPCLAMYGTHVVTPGTTTPAGGPAAPPGSTALPALGGGSTIVPPNSPFRSTATIVDLSLGDGSVATPQSGSMPSRTRMLGGGGGSSTLAAPVSAYSLSPLPPNPPPPITTTTTTVAQGTVPPLRGIIWKGFVLNSLFYGAIIGVWHTLTTVAMRFLRRVARVTSGRCVSCGYDVEYDFISGCPECGWRRGRPGAVAAGAVDHSYSAPSRVNGDVHFTGPGNGRRREHDDEAVRAGR